MRECNLKLVMVRAACGLSLPQQQQAAAANTSNILYTSFGRLLGCLGTFRRLSFSLGTSTFYRATKIEYTRNRVRGKYMYVYVYIKYALACVRRGRARRIETDCAAASPFLSFVRSAGINDIFVRSLVHSAFLYLLYYITCEERKYLFSLFFLHAGI